MTTSWLESISEDLRSDPSISKFKDVDTLAKSYREQSRLMGKRVPMLTADATPEEKAEFWDKMGRPKTAAEYEMPPENTLNGVKFDPAVMAPMFKTMHDAGLSKQQAAVLVQSYAAQQAASLAAANKAYNDQRATALDGLKKEWGTGEPFDQKLAIAKSALGKFGGPDMLKFLDEKDWANEPKMIKMLYEVGKGMLDSDLYGTGGRLVVGPVEAKEQIAALQKDKDFMTIYRDGRGKPHTEAVKKMTELWQAAYPEQEK